LGEISVLGQAVTIVYVLPLLLLVVPPELEDEPLAQPATSEIATVPTAMAEIVLFFPRISALRSSIERKSFDKRSS
jgi:hypothetical protein